MIANSTLMELLINNFACYVVKCVCNLSCKTFVASFIKLSSDLDAVSSCGLANDCLNDTYDVPHFAISVVC